MNYLKKYVEKGQKTNNNFTKNKKYFVFSKSCKNVVTENYFFMKDVNLFDLFDDYLFSNGKENDDFTIKKLKSNFFVGNSRIYIIKKSFNSFDL